ncbi:hypothetical protein M5G20_05480 [Pseudomonas sp. TNT2022 ID1044]|uniref:hypothetical protein n=1 Tax=Pseudomonas sp. TNT2022 ID1044 TaxID=2942636 RepID=UPI00236045A7|nr:hypothetical protein [Pseudomonas sp. TNT2022 ID1044]MDD0995317.1 hypothetical protein [Pseudomonas sp. TNT2022 ID1044]
MDKKDTQRGSAVVKVLQSDSMVDLGKELLELGFDAVLESGVLKDIPIVNTVFGTLNAVGIARDQIFANKLLRFLSRLSEIPKKDRIAMVEKLNEDDKFSGRVGASIIEILDRMESEKKPELAAKCFASYAREEISFEELRRILFALERLPSFDIEKLGSFAKMTMEDSMKLEESLLLAFVNAGFGKNNGGFDGGAIVPTSLCELFLRIGLAP